MTKIPHLVMPQDLNPHGSLFGGTMMSWMDVAAAIEAMTITKHNCVTVHVSELNFIHGAKQGDMIEVCASELSRGRKSLTLKVGAYNVDWRNDLRTKITEANYVFVARNDEGTASVAWNEENNKMKKTTNRDLETENKELKRLLHMLIVGARQCCYIQRHWRKCKSPGLFERKIREAEQFWEQL